MPNLVLTRDEADELRQAVVDAMAGAIGRDDKTLAERMASLRDRLAGVMQGWSDAPVPDAYRAALGVLVLTPATRRWLGAHDPKALAQADAVLEPILPAELHRARTAAASVIYVDPADALHQLRDRLLARAAFLKALKKLAENARAMEAAAKKLHANESLGGYPESFTTFEEFSGAIAEWLREQAEEWLLNPLDEEEG